MSRRFDVPIDEQISLAQESLSLLPHRVSYFKECERTIKEFDDFINELTWVISFFLDQKLRLNTNLMTVANIECIRLCMQQVYLIKPLCYGEDSQEILETLEISIYKLIILIAVYREHIQSKVERYNKLERSDNKKTHIQIEVFGEINPSNEAYWARLDLLQELRKSMKALYEWTHKILNDVFIEKAPDGNHIHQLSMKKLREYAAQCGIRVEI